MIVAFCACPWMLAAPGAWVCALATAIDPSTITAAAKVIVIFRIRSSCLVVMSGKLERISAGLNRDSQEDLDRRVWGIDSNIEAGRCRSHALWSYASAL